MKHVLIAAAGLCLAAGAAQADVTVGQYNFNTCVPYACSTTVGVGVQQQVYASSQFATPMSIGSISFYRADASTSGTVNMDTQTFNLAFYYTNRSAAFGASGLTTNLASNLGAMIVDFGTFTVSGTMPSVLTFASTSTFNYNPLLGNLLLQVTPSNGTAAFDGAVFQADQRGLVTSRAYATEFGNARTGVALVTTFSSAVAAPAVPEPATWAMMIGGFGMIGATMRRRQMATVRFA